MTTGISTANVANGWLNTLRGGSNFTALTPYAKLHVGDPGSAGANNAAAGDTTRKAITQAAASGGSIALSSNVGPWTNGGTSETLTHISVWDASTSAGRFTNVWIMTPSSSHAGRACAWCCRLGRSSAGRQPYRDLGSS